MIQVETETITLTKQQYAVYSCICYFDIFKYPVKPNQIFEFTSFNTSQSQVNLILNELIELKLISESDGFYFLENVNKSIINSRTESEKRFLKRQKKIQRYANFVSRFPFVKSVCISGSCSKNLLDEDGDIDYFIITSPNKLWLCRSILIAFKKLFLFNSKKYFCVNYLVDANNLLIPDKNIFVATEIKTLVPVNNKNLFDLFLSTNSWVSDFLPNKHSYSTSLLKQKPTQKYFFKLVEFMLSNKLGDKLDKYCFNLTLSLWQKKFPDFSKEEFDLNLRSRKNVSKHHPRGYQKKVLSNLHTRLKNIQVATH